MANLNLDILQQSVEKLSREYEKNLLDSERDQLSLKRASALLEGLKGIFGIDDLSLIAAGNLFCISVVIDDYNLEIYVDPSQDLKLQSVQVSTKIIVFRMHKLTLSAST